MEMAGVDMASVEISSNENKSKTLASNGNGK
jgi:hypothetical protein